MECKYQEHSIQSIMDYFVKGFALPDGSTLVSMDWFYDVAKGQVVFKLWMKREAPDGREGK